MALTKNIKNELYNKIFNSMLKPEDKTDDEIVDIVESVVGSGKNISVIRAGAGMRVKVQDGKDLFEMKVLSEPYDEADDRRLLNG